MASKLRKSTQVAVGGMSAALCLVLMLLSSMIPFATFALPAFAGFALLPCAIEMGMPSGLTTYVAVSLLSLLIVPDKEVVVLFILFFGFYPLLRFKLQKLKNRFIRGMIKVFTFNASILGAYGAMIYLFGMTYLLSESEGQAFTLGILAFANFAFWLYDFCIHVLLMAYFVRFRRIWFKV